MSKEGKGVMRSVVFFITMIKDNKQNYFLLFLLILVVNCNNTHTSVIEPKDLSTTIRYKEMEGIDPNLLSLDIYYSALIEQKKPVVIYVHGGAWSLGDKANQLENPVKKLLDFTESLTPSDEKMSALPFFYKQLFVGQQILHKDFWVGRDKELQTAQKAVARYHKGYKGAIAVVAENGLGKSNNNYRKSWYKRECKRKAFSFTLFYRYNTPLFMEV